jgi:uncharacterized peroxidase-related enzyme
MARIEPLPRSAAHASLRPTLAEAEARLPEFVNQLRTLAHQPHLARRLIDLYLGFQEESVVDRRLVELAVLIVSHANRCVYCVSHHTPLGLRFGLSQEALADLEAGAAMESSGFSKIEKLVIAYAEQVTRDPRRVSDELFTGLKRRFDDAQIVELTVRISLAGFFNRLNDALRIELEPGVQEYGLADGGARESSG